MSHEMLGIYLLVGLFAAILTGFPIAFTLMFSALVVGLYGVGGQVFELMLVQFERTMESSVLVAVPLFILMGYLMSGAGLMERLFAAFRLMFAPLNGSLYIAVILTATIFAMSTGIVGASVTVIGLMAGKMMVRSGYDVRLSAGAIAAGGTLGILIPPSIMLIVMGPILRVSILELFAAAVVPGFLLAGIFLLYALVRCIIDPSLGPALPKEERAASKYYLLKEFIFGVLPLSIVIGVTLGSILAGIATASEAAAVGAFGAFLLTLAYRRLTGAMLLDCLRQTLVTTSMVIFLIAAANFFGSVFSILGTPFLITDWLIDAQLNEMWLIIVVLTLVFLLGWALDWAPIVLIFLPVIYPVVIEFDINMVWFATLIAVCLQTAWLSPPVALSAYFLKASMPEWKLTDIYMGMAQFLVLQVIGLALIVAFPQIVLWLPELMFGR